MGRPSGYKADGHLCVYWSKPDAADLCVARVPVFAGQCNGAQNTKMVESGIYYFTGVASSFSLILHWLASFGNKLLHYFFPYFLFSRSRTKHETWWRVLMYRMVTLPKRQFNCYCSKSVTMHANERNRS
jgi:hypothetical protein